MDTETPAREVGKTEFTISAAVHVPVEVDKFCPIIEIHAPGAIPALKLAPFTAAAVIDGGVAALTVRLTATVCGLLLARVDVNVSFPL